MDLRVVAHLSLPNILDVKISPTIDAAWNSLQSHNPLKLVDGYCYAVQRLGMIKIMVCL